MNAPALPGVPILGNLLQVQRSLLGTFESAAKLGDVVQVNFLNIHTHLVVHPDAIKRVFVDHHKNYGKRTRGYQLLRQVLGNGLVTSEGDFWRRQRRIAQPAFHHQQINTFLVPMVEATQRMLDRWQSLGAQPIAVDADFMALTLEIVGRALLSVDLSDESGEVGQAVATLMRAFTYRVVRPLLPPLWVPTPKNLEFQRSKKAMDDVVYRVIGERRGGQKPPKPDLLSMFMDVADEETGERMTDLQLRDEVFTMITAGHETTANALNWTLHLLDRNPKQWELLGAEVDRVLGGRAPTLEDLPQLVYVDAVIKESMRLYPPVWVVARSLEEDDVIGGFTIPGGTWVFLSPWVTHRDPRFWREPELFDPQRFLSGELEQQPKYAYFPFAGGPRVCIGNGFALMEAKVILAMVAQRYRMRSAPGHQVELEQTLTLRPKNGLMMLAERRS